MRAAPKKSGGRLGVGLRDLEGADGAAMHRAADTRAKFRDVGKGAVREEPHCGPGEIRWRSVGEYARMIVDSRRVRAGLGAVAPAPVLGMARPGGAA